MAGLEHKKTPELNLELLGAYKPHPYVHISYNEKSSHLLFNKSKKRLSDREIKGYKLRDFNGNIGELEELVGKDKIFELIPEDIYNPEKANEEAEKNKKPKDKKHEYDSVFEFFYWLFTGKHTSAYYKHKNLPYPNLVKKDNPGTIKEDPNKFFLLYVQYKT
ncbi:MAG: hypothetical protein Q8N99_07495 [Nanoarchaeota archaeon]|nr:hypothetical protein [Nanoarchaeota archaeon]